MFRQMQRLRNNKMQCIWVTGIENSERNKLSNYMARKLRSSEFHAMVIDADEMLRGVSSDLEKYNHDHNKENSRRAAAIAKMCIESDVIPVCSVPSTDRDTRGMVRWMLEREGYTLRQVFIAPQGVVSEQGQHSQSRDRFSLPDDIDLWTESGISFDKDELIAEFLEQFSEDQLRE